MSKRKTHEQFVEEVESKFGDVYTFHSEYTGSNKKIEIEHKVCGHRWSSTTNNFLMGKSKCPKCSGKMKYTTETFSNLLEKNSNGEFSLVSEYIWNKAHITIRHNVCGYERRVNPFDVFHGDAGCPLCNNRRQHTTEVVEELIYEKYGTEYTLVSESTSSTKPILVRHYCGEVFETLSSKFIFDGSRCPKCFTEKISSGEMKIKHFLEDSNIKFVREFSFADCRNINPLPFDFAIFGEDNRIEYLIEFDGKQHFEPVEFFGGKEGFRLTRLRDYIKNNYCKDNSKELIRIPYWDEDIIRTILSELLIEKEVA